jgi:23S rRNA (cytidine1920-2'-O)/16S rRNA (cytidine1409-2'-O)-methyltransferase
MAKKERADKLLVQKGLVESREKAQALIMAGSVYADGKRVEKAGERIPTDAKLEVRGRLKYVSRGGYKLEKALNTFGVEVKGKTCLDVGASTGGFTDCLLQRGAVKVYAVDVGTGQLDYGLRKDPRVVSYEKTDARSLTEEHIPQKVDLITVDVSFIPLEKVLPSVVRFLKEGGEIIALVKPQFELSPREVKKGVVRKREDRRKAVQKVVEFATESLNLSVKGITKSAPKGPKGNEEFLLYLTADGRGDLTEDWEKRLEAALDEEVPKEVF